MDRTFCCSSGRATVMSNISRIPTSSTSTARTCETHLAFGDGIHRCPGAPMARQEVFVALQVLRSRLPRLQLAPDYQPTYAASYFFRSPERVLAVW